MTVVTDNTQNLREPADRTAPDSDCIELLEHVERLGAKIWEEEPALQCAQRNHESGCVGKVVCQ